MNNVLVAGTGATILLFAITYEYMKVKKGHTSNDHEGPIIIMHCGVYWDARLAVCRNEGVFETQGVQVTF